MDVRSIRKARLRDLVERHGGQAELARKIDSAPAYISQLLNLDSRNVGHDFARKVEDKLRLPSGWMDTAAPDADGDAPAAERLIPVISHIQAGNPRAVVDSHEVGDGWEYVGVDQESAQALGPYAFALKVEGESMLPEYREGDLVIVDPDEPVRPGDIVVAKVNGDQDATMKKYRSRGSDREGCPVFELAPLNDNYATLTVDAQNPGHVIGPVVEHRRRLRRR